MVRFRHALLRALQAQFQNGHWHGPSRNEQPSGSRQPVEILRDTWGIPRVYAKTQHDLFFAQGFVAAQDRLWQHDVWRRQAEGKLAEILAARTMLVTEEHLVRERRSGRTGFYLAVAREGGVTAGDAVALIARHDHVITVADIFGLYTADAVNQDLLRQASELSALPEGWRDYFRKRLWEPDA